MNAKTVLNVKTDKSLKEAAQKVARDMGLPLGTIVNHYLRDFVAEKSVTFSSPLIPNKKTLKLIAEVERDVKIGRNIVGPFATAKEMDAYLDS